MSKKRRFRDTIFVCRDCGFVDSFGSEHDLDKCPYCHGDDWIWYEKIESVKDDGSEEDT